MKKLLALLSMMAVSYIGTAQTTTTTAPAPKQIHAALSTKQASAPHVQNAAAWACPKCFAITKDGGTCTHCNTAKVQLGTYYCPSCMKTTGAKPGKCPTCSGATVQMTRKLCASHKTAVVAPAKAA